MDLNVTTRWRRDNHVVVTATGEMDLHTAPRLEGELSDLLDDGASRLVIDLSGVEFCDSTGVNVLFAALRQAGERGGSLCLVSPQPAVRKVLGITGLDSIFPIRDSVAEAVGDSPETSA